MRKMSLAMIALAGSVAMAASASASIIVTTARQTGVGPGGTDVIYLYALGSGADATIVSAQVSMLDNTSAGLKMGAYTSGIGANKRFNVDVDGSQAAANVGSSTDPNGIPDAFSWIGNGQVNSVGWTDALNTPDANGGPNVPNTGYTTQAANPYTGPLAAFHVEGGWTAPVDASAVGGGLGNGKGALIALALVPTGDAFEAKGNIGGLVNTVPFDVTNGTSGVPEPASLGVLAIGGAALLARRKKA